MKNLNKVTGIDFLLLRTISAISLLIMMILFIVSTTYNSFVSMDAKETPIISLNPVYVFIIFILFILFLLTGQSLLKNINNKYFFVVALLIFILLGLYLVIFADDYLRKADPGATVQIARQFNENNFGGLRKKGNYLDTYPFQIYWISWLRILLGINNSIRFLYIVNLAFVSTAMVFMYLINKFLLINNKNINISTLISFMFLPQLFNVLFVYANVPSLTLFLVFLYTFLISFKYSEFWLYISVVFLVLSYLLKNNYLIGIIAFYIIIFLLKIKISKKLIILVLSVALICCSNLIVGHYYSKINNSNFSFNTGVPKSAYVMMGLQEHDTKSGWFDASTVNLYKKSKYSSKLTDKLAKKELFHRNKELIRNPKEMLSLFKIKWISTWSDPTFQSLWNAPLTTWQGKFKTKIMASIYSIDGRSKLSRLIRRVSQLSVWTILSGSIISSLLIIKKKNVDYVLLIYISFSFLMLIGAFVFHTFWETKAQYVYQYIFILVPSAAYGLDQLPIIVNNLIGGKD